MSDPVNHPTHYTNSPAKCECGKGIECITVTQHLSFCLGSAMKYIWRCDEKGKPIEDLEKAIKYLQFEIALRKLRIAERTYTANVAKPPAFGGPECAHQRVVQYNSSNLGHCYDCKLQMAFDSISQTWKLTTKLCP